MTGRQSHVFQFVHFPGTDDVTAGIGIFPQASQHGVDLVVNAPVVPFPAAPLLPVNRAEVAVLVGPFVPDRNAMLVQVSDIRVPVQKPE